MFTTKTCVMTVNVIWSDADLISGQFCQSSYDFYPKFKVCCCHLHWLCKRSSVFWCWCVWAGALWVSWKLVSDYKTKLIKLKWLGFPLILTITLQLKTFLILQSITVILMLVFCSFQYCTVSTIYYCHKLNILSHAFNLLYSTVFALVYTLIM